MGFTRAELEQGRSGGVPDFVGHEVRLLLCGINPGLHSGLIGAPFSRPGNRFYPALYRAGILDRVVDASEGWSDADRAHLAARGIGLTRLVARPTARADELSRDELVEGGRALDALVASLDPTPKVVAVLGLGAFRIAFGAPKAPSGRSGERMHGAELWALPNPSGLNAHESVASLAAAYREAAIAAGIEVYAAPLTPP